MLNFLCTRTQKKELAGVDVFLDWWKVLYYGTANVLGALVESLKL